MDTFRGQPLSTAVLQRADLERRPLLSVQGRIRSAALAMMDGRHTLAEIVRAMRTEFPEQLRSDGEVVRILAPELAAGVAVSEVEPAAKPMGAAEVSARS